MNWKRQRPIVLLWIVIGAGGTWGLAATKAGKTAPPKPASVNQLSPQEQALFDAVKAGDKDKVKKLIADGVDVNCRPAPGWETPLFAAIDHQYITNSAYSDIAQLLIDAGADIHAMKRYQIGRYRMLCTFDPPIGLLEFEVSEDRISLKVVKSLLNAGANINEVFRKRQIICSGTLVDGTKTEFRNEDHRLDGYTPLLTALGRNRYGWCGGTPPSNEDVAIYLIQRGADLTITTRDGITPLYQAMDVHYQKAVELLVDKGVLDSMTDRQRKAIFAKAIALGNKEMVKRVMKYGISPNSTIESEGGSPLNIAIKYSNWESLEFLLKLGVSPAPQNFSDCHAKPPLVQLTESLANGRPYPKLRRAVQMLIAHGADINQSDCHGSYPLLITIGRVGASEEACVDTIQMLVDFGADMNRFQDKGPSPLAFAIREKSKMLIEFLLTHGADPIHSIRDMDGTILTPLELAQKLGDQDIVDLLKQHIKIARGDF